MYKNGGDLFGVADLEPAREFVIAQGGETLGEYSRAISIGIRLSDAIVDRHSPNETPKDSYYWFHVYSVVTPALNFLAQRVQREIQADGYKAFPIPGSVPYNRETLKGVFSHKLAAHLAGLGWIGKSCLLVTPEFGPRVRFVTVLTDAPIMPGATLNRKCGKCQDCVAACPVKALKGIEFQPADPVEVRFDTRICEEYRRTHACGLCVAKCPVGPTHRLTDSC
ncbi:4Fe-4S dicluster domain-containing protein [Chloroflexota bacterium]